MSILHVRREMHSFVAIHRPLNSSEKPFGSLLHKFSEAPKFFLNRPSKLAAENVRVSSKALAETSAAVTAAAEAAKKIIPIDADMSDDDWSDSSSATINTSVADESADNHDAASLV